MNRLARATLAALPPSVARPAYDLDAARIGIVHLGIGAFHRAHQAWYVDQRLAAGELDWAICGVSLRSPETQNALAPQDGLYTLAERSGAGENLRVIGAVRELLAVAGDSTPLLTALDNPAVRIVSLTVTEKGYCHEPATGALREDDAAVRADLANPTAPRSVPGILVEALRRRRAAGIAPFTLLSCDNLPHNGATLHGVLRRYAALRDPALGHFIASEIACPATMVDRIVPATTDADRDAIAAALGLRDAWPVLTEPFSQFVVEDYFPSGRPQLEAAGVQFVRDVAPYELMKLRLLNGAHSAIAYLGYLAGYATVAETIADPGFARFILALWEAEISPTLPQLAIDLSAYKRDLLKRFANPALHHRTWQIAMDGSQKLPQRLLGTLRDRLAAGAPFPRIALAIAAWMRYVTGTDERGAAIEVSDPLAPRLRAIADAAGPVAERLAPALLGVRDIFGEDLAAHPLVRQEITAALAALYAGGAARCVAEAA